MKLVTEENKLDEFLYEKEIAEEKLSISLLYLQPSANPFC
jgi:hypothetical protein